MSEGRKQFDIIAVGGSTIDLFLELDGEGVEKICDPDGEQCVLALDYPDKLPVKSERRTLGAGNAANFIVGASRLGLNTALCSIVGADTAGDQIVQVLERENVATDFVRKEGAQSINVVLSFAGDRTILSHHQKGYTYTLPDNLPECAWLYFTSVGEEHESLHESIPHLVRERDEKLAFNPGSRQMREGVEAMQPILDVCEVLIVNRREACELTDSHAETPELLQKLHELGPTITVITEGSKGSYAFDGNTGDTFFLPATDAEPVDTTGAGDSFGAGFVSALAGGDDVQTALKWGTINAASVIRKVGAHNGLLTAEQMKERLSEHEDITVKKL